MATNDLVPGPFGGYVAQNVRRLREEQGLSLAQLSARLAEVGRPILSSGLHRLENGRRRVDVDDLAGLALALGVAPVSLLLPHTTHGELAITDVLSADARGAWEWVRARRPLANSDDDGTAALEFARRALPRALMSYDQTTPAGQRAFLEEVARPWSENDGGDRGERPAST